MGGVYTVHVCVRSCITLYVCWEVCTLYVGEVCTLYVGEVCILYVGRCVHCMLGGVYISSLRRLCVKRRGDSVSVWLDAMWNMCMTSNNIYLCRCVHTWGHIWKIYGVIFGAYIWVHIWNIYGTIFGPLNISSIFDPNSCTIGCVGV